MTTNEEDFELELPFISVKSKGGPHDDDSFVAGFEMGTLDVILGMPYLQVYTMTIHTVNLKQADLIAMHYDCKMEVESEEDDMTVVTFERVCTCDETVPDK